MRNLVSYQISETLFRKKKQYVPPMLPSRLPKSDANLNRCFTSTKCKKILNRKIIYRVDRILTIKLLATKKTFERFSIAFHVFPIKMSLPLSPFIRDFREAFGQKAALPLLFGYSDQPVAATEKIGGCFFKGLQAARDCVHF